MRPARIVELIGLSIPDSNEGSISVIQLLSLTIGSIGTLAVPGTLAFESGALYVVLLSPGAISSLINVGGKASLAGVLGGQLRDAERRFAAR